MTAHDRALARLDAIESVSDPNVYVAAWLRSFVFLCRSILERHMGRDYTGPSGYPTIICHRCEENWPCTDVAAVYIAIGIQV